MSGTADSTKMCAISMGLSMSEMHALSTAPSMSRIVRFSSLHCYELQPDIRHPHGELGLASPLEVFDIDNVVNDDTLRWSDTDYGAGAESYRAQQSPMFLGVRNRPFMNTSMTLKG